MTLFKKSLLFTLAFSLLPAQAATVLIYSDHEPYGNMRTRFIHDVFFKQIEKESGGNLRIEPHWGGEIAKAHGELQAIADGKTDMIVAVPEYSAKQLPLHQLFKGFMLGPSGREQVATLRRIYDTIPELNAEYEKNGVKPVLIATGYPVAFFSKAPLASLSEVKGQTWRSASFWHRDFLRNAGATPTTSPWGEETYKKLANGEIQGLMVNIDSAIDIKAYEHTPYALVAKAFWLGHIYPVVINKNKWDSLSPADQQAIARAATTAYQQLGEIMEREYAQMLQTARDKGVTLRELSQAEVEEWGRLTNYPVVLERWAAEQEAQGIPQVKTVLERLKAALLPRK